MNDLICLPAVDIRDGKCVRLLHGDFAQETVYGDPLDQALRYADGGATWLHVVDLDAARCGSSNNREVIVAMIERSDLLVQVGGGIRDEQSASFYLEAGARRVIVGTAAMATPELVDALASAHPGKIGLGLDHRLVEADGSARREIAVHGWEVSSGIALDDAVSRFESINLGAVVVTDIARDGALVGPDLEGYRHLLGQSALPFVASGGIKGAEDLVALAQLEANGRRLDGAIVGRALLSGAMTLEEAISVCAR